MNSILTKISACIVVLLLFSSFQADLRKQLMDAEIEKRREEYRKLQKEDCEKRAIKEAEMIVDSILIANAINVRAYDTEKPDKPLKPDKPEIIKPKDSLPVKPLFDQE